MWSAKYKEIDNSGLQAELKVMVEFSNGSTTYLSEYRILPSELDQSFPSIIQSQIDILNAKEIPKNELNARIDTKISTEIDIQPVEIINP